MTPEVPGPPWRTTVGEGGLLPSLPSLQKVSGWSAIGRAVGCPPIPLSGPQETDLEGTASQCLLLHPGLQGGLHDNDEGDEGTKTLPASLTEPSPEHL